MDFQNLIRLISNTVFSVLHFFVVHLKSHYFPLDSMRHFNSSEQFNSEFSKTKSKLNWKDRFYANFQYSIPFFSLLMLNVDTVFVFRSHSYHYNSTGMPDLFTHKVFPSIMWPLGDLEMVMGIETEFAIYGLLLLVGPVPTKLLIYVIPKNVIENQKNSYVLVQNGKGNFLT